MSHVLVLKAFWLDFIITTYLKITTRHLIVVVDNNLITQCAETAARLLFPAIHLHYLIGPDGYASWPMANCHKMTPIYRPSSTHASTKNHEAQPQPKIY